MGYQVLSSFTAQGALELAKHHAFDLMISDLGLPDLTGHELMIQIKRNYSLKGIALSGYGMEEDIKASLDSGFEIHLTKPVQTKILETAINELFPE